MQEAINTLKKIILLVSLSAINALAQNNVIELNADYGEYDQEREIATYTGNVNIRQDGMHLKGERVVIHLKNNQIQQIETWGNPAQFTYQNKQPPIEGEGQYMRYQVAQETIDIEGNARLTQTPNQTEGDKLSYNLRQEQIKGSNVNIIFTPETNIAP